MVEILCVGTGRDGTLSLNAMIAAIFAAEGRGRRSMHEYEAAAFYQDWCEWRETGDPHRLAALRRRIAACPYEGIVGNGYAAVLDLFTAPGMPLPRLIHLQRRDRAACLASLARNARMFPATYGYYAVAPGAAGKRMAAFHFGELSQADWERLTLEERLAWYYDKTHALIAAGRERFDGYLHVATEDLDEPETRRRIADFVAGEAGLVPDPVHLNAHALVAVDRVPADRRDKLQWLFGRLDVDRVLADDAHFMEYALNQFIAWSGYQITGAIAEISPADRRSPAEIRDTLMRAVQALGKTARDIELLLLELDQRFAE